jgi:hypothetical protein
MALLARVEFLRQLLRDGRSGTAHVSFNGDTRCEKVKLIIGGKSPDGGMCTGALSVLDYVDVAIHSSTTSVMDRGHRHSSGSHEVCFYLRTSTPHIPNALLAPGYDSVISGPSVAHATSAVSVTNATTSAFTPPFMPRSSMPLTSMSPPLMPQSTMLLSPRSSLVQQSTMPQSSLPQSSMPHPFPSQSSMPQSSMPQSSRPQSTMPRSPRPPLVQQSSLPQSSVPQDSTPLSTSELFDAIYGSGLHLSSLEHK